MANVKNITELPVAESAEGLNLIVNDGGAAKQIAASAVGAQADWNENDPTKPDYVKNRPFWTDDIIENIIVPEQIISGFEVVDAPISIYCVENPFTMPTPPVLGDTYIVNWDGTNYTVLASFSGEGLCYLGNKNYATMVPGGDIPFAIITIPGGGPIVVVTESTAISHTISVKKLESVVHKIDEKYIPKNLLVDSPILDLDKVCVLFGTNDSFTNFGGYHQDEQIHVPKEKWNMFIQAAIRRPSCIGRPNFSNGRLGQFAIGYCTEDHVEIEQKEISSTLEFRSSTTTLEYDFETEMVTVLYEYFLSEN